VIPTTGASDSPREQLDIANDFQTAPLCLQEERHAERHSRRCHHAQGIIEQAGVEPARADRNPGIELS